MSKTIICIRHGKAKDGIGLADYDRPLHKKGREQAEITAQNLSNHNFHIDQIIYSSALRTTESAIIISKLIGYKLNNAISSKKLYLCTPNEMEDFVAIHVKAEAETIAIIGHNNGLSDWVNQLLQPTLYHTLGTCEFAALQLNISSWEQIFDAPKAHLLCFESPKTKL